MRNITNTSENVNNRNITNSINTNTLLATLPLELNNNGLDDVISIKGLSALGTSNQFLRMKSDASGLEFITLTFVDLNSTQTLTNKTLSTGCNFTGNRIAKANLDDTLIDTTTGQTVQNKTLKGCSLNYNSGTNTLIGSINTNTYTDGTLNINSATNQAIIRIANDSNHSIYLRKNLANVDNTMAFYSFKNIEYYTGNGSNLNQANYIKRLAISNTEIISNLEFVSNDIKTRNIYLRENTASNGDNYINIKAPANLDTNFTLNVKAESGTIALTTDIPEGMTVYSPLRFVNNVLSLSELSNFGSANQILQVNSNGNGLIYADLPTMATISANSPVIFSNNVISLGGLTSFGSNGQVIKVNSNGNGFIYSDFNNLSSNDVIQFIQNANNVSTYAGSGLDTDPTTLGNGSGSNPRNTNINGKDIILNSSTTNTKLQIGGADKVILTTSLLLSKTKLLVSSTKTAIDSSSMFEVSSSGLSKLLINSEGSSGDCELSFKLLNGSTTHSGHIYYRNADRHLDIESFEQINFSYTSGGNQLQKYQFSLSTLTLDPTTTMNLKINNSTKLALTSTLSTLSGDTVRLSNGSGNTRLEIQNALTYSVNPLLISSSSTSLESNAQFQVDSSGAVKAILKTSSNSNDIELAFKNGNQQGQIKMIGSNNGLEFQEFSKYTFKTSSNDRFIINGTNISRSNLLISDNSTALESNYKFQVDSSDNTKMLIKTTATDKSPELVLKNGTLEGSLKLNVFNSLEIGGFSGITLNNPVTIIYNNANSFVRLMSATSSSKIGLNFFQDTSQGKLYMDFSNGNLVYESNNGSNQRLEIQGNNPELVDSNDNILVGKNGNGVLLGNSSMNTFIRSSSYIQIEENIDMTYNKIRLRGQGDDNHYIAWTNDDSIDGPKLLGFEGVGAFTRYGLAYRAKNDGTTPKLCAPNGMSCNSDDRIKFNETPVINAIDTINKLRPVYYNKASELDYIGITSTLPTEYGFIAQDTYNNVPELRQSVIFNKTLPRNFVDENLNGDCVEDIYNQTTDSDGKVNTYRDICGFNYDNLHAINVKAIQELYKLLQDLQNEIIELKSNK